MLGTNCERSADAPAAALKNTSNVMWVSTCTDCCNATAVVARNAPSPPFCRKRVLNASPPTPAGVVVAAKVLATCMTVSVRNLTNPSAHAHSAAAAPTYFSAETANPASAHHQFALRNSEKNTGTELMNG